MMMLSEASYAMQGVLNGVDGRFESVEIDTRRLEQDALYFAIHGENKNGHDFIRQAVDGGAVAAVSDENFNGQSDTRHIRVDDTTSALGMLAQYWREQFSVPVVGITGSNGKTTVCQIVSTLFAEHIPGIAPHGSFNNHWGVPLTLLKLREKHQSAVIEMGMNHAGELSYLGRIVRPTIGLITNAAAAHLEGLKTIEGVAKAKGELIDFVRDEGTVILNRDDRFYPDWSSRAANRRRMSFGVHPESDVRILGTVNRQLELRIHGQVHVFEYALLGTHNQLNAAAAVAVAVAAGVPVDAIRRGLEKVLSVSGRLDALRLSPESLLIDDTYNANQASMRAAIDVLADQPGHKVLVLGGMGELGADSSEIHLQIAAYARHCGIDSLLTLVDQHDAAYLNDMAAYLKGFGSSSAAYTEVGSLVNRVQSQALPMTVLVKGSRFARMERVVEEIKTRGGSSC